jgi:hypothetical protein
VILDKGLFVYNMHIIVEKHLSISIAPGQSQDRSLIHNNAIPYLHTLSQDKGFTGLESNQLICILFGGYELHQQYLPSSYPYPIKWGRYNMFFIML